MRRVGAVILAAGASTRLGQPKQLVVLEGETLIERAVRVASTVCEPVVIVLGCKADEIQSGCHLGNAMVTVNKAWSDGMGSSLRAGMVALGKADGVVIMTCDMPAVTAKHLGLLLESGDVAASAYGGGRGVPAYFPASSFPELHSLRSEGGAKLLLEGALTVELASGELDIDTPADLKRTKAHLRQPA